MRIYQLRREQWIAARIEDVFRFFSDATNLEAITPPWMRFRLVAPGPIEMRAGARIEYALKYRIIPVRWLTEIERWDPPRCFVDNQIAGPYKLWRHTHRFAGDRGGTVITDEVSYALPLGPLGRLAHALRVRRDVESIFEYRRARIEELAGFWTALRTDTPPPPSPPSR